MTWRAVMVLVLAGAWAASASAGALLVPDSSGKKIWAFDPYDGSVVNNNFIPNDGHFVLPMTPLDSGHGSILISDQNADAVFEYGYDGTYIRTVAGPANGLDNVRGIGMRNDQVYVAVDGGTNPNSIQRFNWDGSGQTTWASGLDSPWCILFRAGDALVSDSGTQRIERFDLNGTIQTPFHQGEIRFPQQLYERANGNVYAAGFSLPTGVYQYDANGVQLNKYPINTGIRGVWELGNGKIFWTDGTRVGTYDPASGTVVDIVNQTGASFRHVCYTPLPEPAAVLALLLGGLCCGRWR